MKPLRALAAPLLALAGALTLAPARASDPAPFRLEEHLPVSTVGLVALEGFPARWRSDLAKTPLDALLGRPEFESEARPLLELLRRALGRTGGCAAMLARVAPVLADLDGRLDVALVAVARDGTPGVVVSLDFGANLSRFVAFVTEVRESLPAGWAAEEALGAAPGERAFGLTDGSSRWIVRTLGTTVVASNQFDVVVGSAPPAGATLATLPAFVGAFGDAPRPGAASVRAYADVAALVTRALDDPAGTVGSKFATAAGLRALTTLSYRAAVEDGAVVESLVLGASKADTGVFSLLRTAPLVRGAGLPEPRRTWARLETSLPVSTWPSRWRAFVHDVDAEDERDVVAGLARLEHVMGADLETGILSHLVDEQTLSVGLSDAGGAFPDVVLSIPLREAEGFEARLARAVDGWCGDRTERGDETIVQRTVPAGGVSMHVVALGARRGAEAPPFEPTWAVVGDRLVLTPVPHTMRACLRRVARGDAGPLAPPPRLEAGGPAARADGTVLAIATRDLFASAYDTLVPLAESLPSWKRAAEAVGFDPARLPAADETVAGWSDSVVSLRIGSAGIALRARSPFGLAALAGLVFASLEAASAPAEETGDATDAGGLEPSASISAPSDDPKRVTSGTLDRIARALREFHALRGAFPSSLDELTSTERLLTAVPRDAWDRPLRYAPPASGAAGAVAIVASAGPDGVYGDDDDVTVDVEAPAK